MNTKNGTGGVLSFLNGNDLKASEKRKLISKNEKMMIWWELGSWNFGLF